MNSYNNRLVAAVALMLLGLPVVRADRVCDISDSGVLVCYNKLSTVTIAAIVLSALLILALLGGGIVLMVHRRRKYADSKASVEANSYGIEASQIRGPAASTTYAPSYDPRSAKPHGASISSSARTTPKARGLTLTPTAYGGATFPLPGPSSARVKTPSAQSAFAGTYTTMGGGIGSLKSAV